MARELPQAGYAEAFSAMLAALTDKSAGVIREASAISAVGHRVVHGGENFTSAVVIDDSVLAEIEALGPLAPLHNPVNAAGIREARRVFAAVPHVAVFDTAFHATLPSHAFLYGLPYEFYEKRTIRRYGFHGSSHGYVALAAAQFLKRRPRELKIVSCHLGNGASLCAIDHGRSVDTTMGFTPGEGLIMGTRCGDIDSGVLAFLERTGGMTAAQIEEMLNKKSGLLGLSGISGDMREVERAADDGDAARADCVEDVLLPRPEIPSEPMSLRWAGSTCSSSPPASARAARACAPRRCRAFAAWASISTRSATVRPLAGRSRGFPPTTRP